MKIFPIFKKIARILNISPTLAGLEINDFELRFAAISDKGKLNFQSVKLPAGTVQQGKIKDQAVFRKSLSELHSLVTGRRNKKIQVVLNIPDSNIFTKTFSIPFVDEKNLKTAAILNLEMISPIEYKTAYSDWQKLGNAESDTGQIEILSAFASQEVIKTFTEAATSANFTIGAIEFPALALARLIDFKVPLDNSEATILLRITNEGLSFVIVRNGNLYFDHFVFWPGEQITINLLGEMLVKEMQKIVNYYSANWQAPIKNLLIVSLSGELEDKFTKIISDNFGFSVHALGDYFSNINPNSIFVSASGVDAEFVKNLKLTPLEEKWFASLGSALRGLIPRSKDTIISLASIGTEDNFLQSQVMNFLAIWRNIVLLVLIFLIVVFGLTDRFVASVRQSSDAILANIDVSNKMKQFSDFENQVKIFNSQIELAKKAKGQAIDLTPLLLKIKSLAGSAMVIDRIYLKTSDDLVTVYAHTDNKNAIIDFKNTLTGDPDFSDVKIPLNLPPAGEINFTATFKAKELHAAE